MIEAGPGIYKVESDTSSKEYIVDLTGAVYSCTCTNWAVQRNRAVGKGLTPPNCKHIRYVLSAGGTAVPTVNKPAASKTANELAALLAELSDEPAPDGSAPDGETPVPVEALPPVPPLVPEFVVPDVPETVAPISTPVDDAVTVSAADIRMVLDVAMMAPDNREELQEAVQRLAAALPKAVTVSSAAEHPVCPRCFGFIPNNERPGEYPGALSRVDNKTEVCSACGTDEGMEQFLDGALTPRSTWPIKSRKYEFPEAKV